MTQPETQNAPRSDLDDSTVAQLIECGLLARYGRDPDGLQWARQAVRDELLVKGWTLPPYTHAEHDFRHAAMHRMADWPVLEQIVAARKSAARRLDSRTVAALYADAGKDEWAAMSKAEHAFATAAIAAHPA
jgi:DNA-binding GntR family transcriptional regulator